MNKLFFSSIDKRDKALCFRLSAGYVESESLDVCYATSSFLFSTCDRFKKVGSINKIRLKTGSVVYRQRVYFTDLTLLCAILGHFNIKLIIPLSFKVGLYQFSKCIDSIVDLERYLAIKGYSNMYTLDTWLLDSCLIQVYILCKSYKVDFICYKELKTIVKNGLLNRAPYICGSFDTVTHISSVLVPPPKYYTVLDTSIICTTDLVSNCYTLSWKREHVSIYGFTLRNLKSDLRLKEKVKFSVRRGGEYNINH